MRWIIGAVLAGLLGLWAWQAGPVKFGTQVGTIIAGTGRFVGLVISDVRKVIAEPDRSPAQIVVSKPTLTAEDILKLFKQQDEKFGKSLGDVKDLIKSQGDELRGEIKNAETKVATIGTHVFYRPRHG